jgi:plastocyanin
MTARWACLAALAAVAPLAVATAVSPSAVAKVERATAGERAHAAANPQRPGTRRRAASGAKHRAHARRMRWRAASAALRIGPGALFGGAAPGDPTAPGSPGSPSAPVPGGGGPAPGPAPVHHTLSVATREFSLTLSRQLLTPGTETIQLNNRGEDPHNLVIGPDDGSHDALATYPDVDSLQSHTQQVDLPAGRYRLWCSLPGHEELGMRATLRVE